MKGHPVGAHQKRTGKLCQVSGKWQRTIGKFINAKGKLAPKKFYLGRDKDHAEVANLRLEKLWARVVEQHAEDREAARQRLAQLEASGAQVALTEGAYQPASIDLLDEAVPPEPRWDKFSLAVADAIRKNEPLPVAADEGDEASEYTKVFQQIKEAYPDVDVQPEGVDALGALLKGRQHYAMMADYASKQYREYAKLANVQVAEPGQASLYEALDTYAAHVEKTKRGETAKVHARYVRRLKQSAKDTGPNMSPSQTSSP